MLQAITQKEFEERFPDIYILDVNQVAYYLETALFYWNQSMTEKNISQTENATNQFGMRLILTSLN